MENQREYAVRGKNKIKLKPPARYHVIMLNDDFTPMDFVVWALKTYFDKSENEATALMLEVHHGKKAIVETYVYDVAVTKSCKVIQEARDRGYPFKVVVDKE